MGISSVTGTWEIGDNWPYPKLFFTDYYIMAVAVKDTKLALYEMTNSGNVWTATEKLELGLISEITNVDIAGFDKYAVIVVNKGATKAIYGRNPTTGAVTSIGVTDIPGANSCCNSNGQLILGGLYSTGAPWSVLGTCSVAWGNIGSVGSFAPAYDNIVPGFRKLPWDENGHSVVHKVLSLGKLCVVYADQGVGFLYNQMVEGSPAKGFKEVSRSGVLSTYAVAGNGKIHGFVDNNYDWNIVTEEGVQNLGYRSFLSSLTGEVVVSFEPMNERFYISNGSLCFVWTKYGMYSTHQCVSSIGMYKNILTGFVKASADTKIRITTNPFDLGIQDNKTMESVESGLVYDTTANKVLSGKLFTKYDYKGDFYSTEWTRLNENGVVTQKLTGREFKFSLQGDYESGADFKLYGITGKVKFSEKTNTRGR